MAIQSVPLNPISALCSSCGTLIEGVDDRGPSDQCDDCRLKLRFAWTGIIGAHAIIIGAVTLAVIALLRTRL